VAKWTFGIFAFKRPTKLDNKGRRGKVEFIVMSSGPGTNTKCVDRVIIGYEAIKSANASKFSNQGKSRKKAVTKHANPGIFGHLDLVRGL
jgi:hypothetical protein